MTPHAADHQAHIDAVIQAVMSAVDPKLCVEKALQSHTSPNGDGIVIAMGKAAPAMFAGYTTTFGELAHKFMLVPEGVTAPAWAHLGDHPFPTQRNVEAAHALITFIEQLNESSLRAAPVTILLSGGASALLTLPHESIPLDDYRTLTQFLMRAGADIHQLNCVRKHAEQLKGGRLAALLAPRHINALILSDVIGDDLSVISSGPISPDPTTFADALNVLKTLDTPPGPVHDLIAAGTRAEHPETPKPGDPIFESVTTQIIANNLTAVEAPARAARDAGFTIAETRTNITGEAADIGIQLAEQLAALQGGPPTAIILGGETTVTVGTATGTGGPSTELALAAALAIEKLRVPDLNYAIATFATDGIDGPTDAAGAIVTNQTLARARQLGLDPTQALANHDSYRLFNQLDALIKPGPTGTNVNDIAVALRY